MILKFIYFHCLKHLFPKKKLRNLDELENFVQTKSAWVSQVTLYSYLKTRMGTRYVLHFDNDEFMKSVNQAKWNIYAIALQDLNFFVFSFLKVNFNFEEVSKAKEIYFNILDDETNNDMPLEIIEEAKKILKKDFMKLIGIIIVMIYHLILALSLYTNGHQ